MAWSFFGLLLFFPIVSAQWPSVCPVSTLSRSEGGSGSKRTVSFENLLDAELAIYWLDFNGVEVPQGVLMPLSEAARESYVGHVFRVKWQDLLVYETKVSEKTRRDRKLSIGGCGELKENPRSTARDAEFAELMHDVSRPCLPAEKSAQWSCVKYLTLEDLKLRRKEDYGLLPNETQSTRRHFMTTDDSYVSQIGKIPQVSPGPGYAKMTFTKELKRLLGDWYLARRNDSLRVHDTIPGGYTNNDVVKIDKVDLDRFPHIHDGIVREMRQILEYWTGLKLKHTSTFGVRVYRRNSVLINHVDRMDTHLASAVIQLHQDVDEGWPLELYLSRGRVAEVYLQPQEIILYEGAWLRHGRPMRFKGNEFANVFSHFAPPDWRGPASSIGGKPTSTNYYGIPSDRLTTLADKPGVLHSNFFDKPNIYNKASLNNNNNQDL